MIGMTKSQPKVSWMEIAMGEIGVAEIVGSSDNPRIVEYHQSTTLRASDDETPWCSSFANWVLKQAGIEGTDSAAALSFRKWGEAVKPADIRYGDICVMDRGSGRGHVGFFVGKDRTGKVILLGGNQHNEVNTTAFDISDFAYFRRPRKLSDTKTAKIVVAGTTAAVAVPAVVSSVTGGGAPQEAVKQAVERSGDLGVTLPDYTESVVGIVESIAPGYGEAARMVILIATAGAILWNRLRDLRNRGL